MNLQEVIDNKAYDQVEVREYLPAREKLELMQRVIECAQADGDKIFNPLKIDIYFWNEVIKAYTNVDLPEDMEAPEVYDLIRNSKFIENTAEKFNVEDIGVLYNFLKDTMVEIFKYASSFAGILEGTKNRFENLDLEAENIRQIVQDPEALKLLKDIAPMIGLGELN